MELSLSDPPEFFIFPVIFIFSAYVLKQGKNHPRKIYDIAIGLVSCVIKKSKNIQYFL